jgi:hypothetical protein
MHNTQASRVCEVAVCVVVLGVLFGWVVPNVARAEDELQQARTEAGRVWYEEYCSPCHGPGGAPGSAVYRDSKQPVDLRTYVQRHGGKFPAGEWIAIVGGSPRSPVHTEVWEKIRRQHQTLASGSAEARGIVAMIAEYVISVQAK